MIDMGSLGFGIALGTGLFVVKLIRRYYDHERRLKAVEELIGVETNDLWPEPTWPLNDLRAEIKSKDTTLKPNIDAEQRVAWEAAHKKICH